MLTQSFQDILKKGFLEQQNAIRLNLMEVITILTITLIVGIFIFIVYRVTFDGVIYSHRYNASILLVALITSLIIMTIHSNIVLSLGMVGALSIVRFRTALKEPMDIVYMFWSIAVGITAGSGLFYLAVGGSIFIGAVLIVLSLIKTERPAYLMILNYDKESKEAVEEELLKVDGDVKSKVLTGTQIELVMKINYSDVTEKVIDELSSIDGVNTASLVNFEENIL